MTVNPERPDILDELHQHLLDSMDQTPARPWQRRAYRPGDDVVIEFGTNDVHW